MSGRTRTRILTLFTLAAGLVLPAAGAAQDHVHEQPVWVTDLGVAAANSLAGAVTAAATAAIRGNDVSEAFLKGAAGGGVLFLGKRLAVERFSGAGLLGREVASVGSSIIANAGDGRGWIEEIWLPLGPAWLQVRPGHRVRARVDLQTVGTIIWAATRSELRFDLDRSLSNGAAVFVAEQHRINYRSEAAAGFARGGVIAIGASTLERDVIQSHENVHVIQHDFMLQTITRPVERWAWGWLTDRDIPVDVGLTVLTYPGFLRRIHESEARLLEFR